MARIALVPPNFSHMLPNTGDGTDAGDTFQSVINNLNTMFTELYGTSARPMVNTAITTVGAGTLTAAGIVGGLITRSGSVAAYSDTTATAAAIIAAATGETTNDAWTLIIKNTVAFAETLVGGSGVTLTGQTIIPPNSVGTFLVTITSQSAVSILGIEVVPLTSGALEANTSISTAGAGTLTGAALAGGVITRTGPSAAYSDATDTGANIIAALPNANAGQSWEVTIKNTVAFTQTITAGDGNVTLSGNTLIPANSAGRFLLTVATATTVTMVGLAAVPLTTAPPLKATALTTVGAGTITGAGIAGGVTNRTGSTAAYTDTTDTAANIIAALPNANVGQSFLYTYFNNTLGVATINGGTGVNSAGLIALVPFNCWGEFIVTYTAAATVTFALIAMGPNVALPASQFVTGSGATLAAGNITGADVVHYTNTGSNASITTRTGAQMFGDIPNCQIGFTYTLLLRNTNATGATLAAADGTVTLSGTMTIAQNVTRAFAVQFTSATAVTLTSMGIFAAGA